MRVRAKAIKGSLWDHAEPDAGNLVSIYDITVDMQAETESFLDKKRVGFQMMIMALGTGSGAMVRRLL